MTHEDARQQVERLIEAVAPNYNGSRCLCDPCVAMTAALRLLLAAAEAGERYHELIYAVGKKFPDETRHETALRYIRQAETPTNNAACAALRPAERHAKET